MLQINRGRSYQKRRATTKLCVQMERGVHMCRKVWGRGSQNNLEDNDKNTREGTEGKIWR